MQFSFQTFLVGVFVTVVHVAAIVTLKPASLEASKFFSDLEMNAFVEDFLVKKGDETTTPEVSPEPSLLAKEDSLSEEATPDEVLLAEGETAKVEASEIDISGERDSVQAVTDVRAFAGRIEEPSLVTEMEEDLETRAVEGKAEARVHRESPEEAVPKKVGPLEVRAIRPVTRS
ncbi:MAG: hypothetical protein AAF733_11600 [Verrucomicrobiota bacterium]